MDFNATFTIVSVKIAPRKDGVDRVETFAMKYSYDGTTWHTYTYQGKEKVCLRCNFVDHIQVA